MLMWYRMQVSTRFYHCLGRIICAKLTDWNGLHWFTHFFSNSRGARGHVVMCHLQWCPWGCIYLIYIYQIEWTSISKHFMPFLHPRLSRPIWNSYGNYDHRTIQNPTFDTFGPWLTSQNRLILGGFWPNAPPVLRQLWQWTVSEHGRHL